MKKSKLTKNIIAIMGMVAMISMITAMLVFARVAQETITVNFNNIRIAVNGQLVQTEFEPFIFQGRTYLPVRDVADAMGFEATWEDATNTVHLTSRNLNITPNYPPHQPIIPVPPVGEIGSITSPPGGQGNRPSSPAISLDRAIEIAYADLANRGINATYSSNSGIDWERGQWVWELLFRTQGEGMPFIEFYINVDNGNIVKFEWDD